MTGSNQDALRHVTPRLVESLRRQRNSDGHLILIGNGARDFLTVGDDEAAALELMDGKNSLHDVVERATKFDTPLRPMATLALMRRLHLAHLVTGLQGVSTDLFADDTPSVAARIMRLVGRLAYIRVPLPGLGAPLAVVGRSIPREAWPYLTKAALGLFAVAMIGTLATGHLLQVLDPFHGDHVIDRTVGLYLAASLLLSLRELVRGLAFTSLGIDPPRATLAILCGVVHLGIDDRQRRAATASERLLLAWAGLATLCLLAACGVLAWMVHGQDNTYLRAFAAVGLYLAAFNAAPYGRGDMWHILGITTLIPDLTKRSAVYLLKRSIKNLMRSEPIRNAERTYLLLASAWLSHWIMALWLVTHFLMPGALAMIEAIARGHTASQEVHQFSAALGFGIAFALFAAVLMLAFGLFAVILSAVMQMLRQEKSTPPASTERIGAGADALLGELRRVPFLATLPDDELRDLAGGMVRERHENSSFLVRQGEPGDRFCFLHSGTCEVLFEEESGLVHSVAKLSAGDFFGEIALLDDIPRTATVRALESVEVYSLDRATFVALVERSTFARDAVLDQVRNAAFLRTVPVFQTVTAALMATLLARVTVLREPAGTDIVMQGERGDAMYVIREGTCDVVRQLDGGGHDRITSLGPGDWFGEIALLRGVRRTASVRTTTASVLVCVPGDVLDEALLHDFQIGLALERAMAQRLIALETS